jgi:hypothetical protein
MSNTIELCEEEMQDVRGGGWIVLYPGDPGFNDALAAAGGLTDPDGAVRYWVDEVQSQNLN